MRPKTSGSLHVALNCHRLNSSCCSYSELKATKYIKYLGITVDFNLNFAEHIELLNEGNCKLIIVFKKMVLKRPSYEPTEATKRRRNRICESKTISST